MFAGIGLNTVLSVVALVLALRPPRGAAAPGPAVGSAAAAAAPAGPAPRTAAARSFPMPRAVRPAAPEEPGPPPAINPAVPGVRGGPASAGASALATRLNLNPRVLSEQLGDASGEIPKPTAERLERAFQAAQAAAKHLTLDEGRAASFVALLTNHTFTVLREEKVAAPGAVPASRLDEIADETLADVRTTCGDAAAAEAKRLLAAR